jgi:hypothetical protein
MLRVSFSAALLALILGVAAHCAATQSQSNALSPKTAPAAALAAGSDMLSQLDPAPTLAELELYKQTRTKSPGDLPKFLATRKYLRQLWAAFPDGKLDPDNAPAPSAAVDYGMALDINEQMVLLQVKIAAGSKGGTQ